MTKIQVLGTGLSGLIGSKLVQSLSDWYDFENLDLSTPNHPTDITDPKQVLAAFERSNAQFVIHCAAFTDVTAAWQQRDDKNGLAYRVNVLGTKNIIHAARKTDKHLIHLSTAYVFDGEKESSYTESDVIHPIEWYGQTKAWAEEEVQSSESHWTILRIDQPFRSDNFAKVDFAHRIVNGLQNGSLHPQFTNHFVGPTFIDDFVKVIEWVMRTNTTGLFHASSGEKWSDYEFARQLQMDLQLPGEVKSGDVNDYLKTVRRPYQKNTSLDCTKLKNLLDFSLTPIEQAIKKIAIT